MEKIIGIYCISNKSYFYVGHSNDIYRRWDSHRRFLRQNKHVNPIMLNVYNKYFEVDPLKYEIVKETSIEDLQKAEGEILLEYIYKFPEKKCMNIANPISELEHFRIVDGKQIDINMKLAIPLQKGEYEQTKIGHKPWKWVKYVQLDIDGKVIKIWDSLKDAEKSLGIRYHKKNTLCGGYQWQKYDEWLLSPKGSIRHLYELPSTIKQYDFNKNLIKEWDSIKEASKVTGIDIRGIQACLEGKRKTSGKFIWSYGKCPNVANPENHIKKKVDQFKNGILIKSHSSIRKAALSVNSNATTLKSCIKNNKELGGFIWKYQK